MNYVLIGCYNIFYKDKSLGQILYGLGALLFARICVNLKEKNNLINKLKRFKILHTVSECQQFQKETEVAIQGYVQTINGDKFVFFQQNCKKYQRQYTQQKIQIIDSFGNKIVGNIQELSLKIQKDAMDYNKESIYKQFVPKEISIFKKLFLFLKHSLFSSTVVEKSIGVSSNQYLTLVGEVKNSTMKIHEIAKKPQAFFQSLKLEIRQVNSIIFLQQILFAVLAGAWACGAYVAFYKKKKSDLEIHQLPVYQKSETDILNENEYCIACTTNARNTILLPCLHLILCDACAIKVKQLRKCPFCRNNIEKLKQVCIDLNN